MNTENLLKLANHLASLPENYDHFDMADFYAKILGKGHECPFYISFPVVDIKRREINITDCNTVACAVGHAYALGIGRTDMYDWYTYSQVTFDLTEEEWEWCFSALWKNIDNTPLGAAMRIYYLLKNEVPEETSKILRNIEEQEYRKIIKDVKIPA